MSENVSLFRFLSRCGQFLLQNIRWFTRSAVVLLLLFVMLHRIHPPAVEWVGHLFGFPHPSLIAIIAALALLFILERVVLLETAIEQPTVGSFEKRIDAYVQLTEQLQNRRARNVDLLQFSGQTALPILRTIADTSPHASIRMLLFYPDDADTYDTDDHPNHAARIRATLEQIILLEDEYKKVGFRVNVWLYKTPPSVSSIVIDDELVSLGWYHCYIDIVAKVLRLRGHDAAAINARGDAGLSLRTFAKRQFELVLNAASPAREPLRSTAHH